MSADGPVHGGGDEEARPTLREKIADELRSTDECSSLDVASPQEYLDDADAVLRIVREHRAGERADAIPGEAVEAALDEASEQQGAWTRDGMRARAPDEVETDRDV